MLYWSVTTSDGFFFDLLEPWDVRALHTENSGFAAATLRRHISTFRGYQILFSIRNFSGSDFLGARAAPELY
jgi:hypothetical protein